MKGLISTITITLALCFCQAQKIAYVDSDYILDQLPNYKLAQENLKKQATNWQKEIQQKQENYEKLLVEYENEKILLTEKQIQIKEEEFNQLKEEINTITEKRFGPNGALLRLRKSLVKPIQDQIANAVNKIAEKERLGFVFDKGSDLIMVYTDPKWDISEKVLRQITGNNKALKPTNKPKKRKRN